MCERGFEVLPIEAMDEAVAAGKPPWLGIVAAPGMVG
jgi:hypothetical protein